MRRLDLAGLCAMVALSACGSSGGSTSGSDVGGGRSKHKDATSPDAAAAETTSEPCGCFAHGRWQIDNISPCIVSAASDGPPTGAMSTSVSGGMVLCPVDTSHKPTALWSTDTLTTDCAGHFRLCLTLQSKKGCVVGTSCAEGDYATPGVAQAWTPLEPWFADAAGVACAAELQTEGGTGELTVTGTSSACAAVEKSLGHVTYCPLTCMAHPEVPGCAECSPGGDGVF